MPEGDPVLIQFGQLTLADFEQHPVWVQCHVVDYDELWYDDTDEETFRPWDGSLPVNPDEAMFLVRATCRLADGTERSGFVTPQSDSSDLELGYMQPYVFTNSGGLLGIWRGITRTEDDRSRFSKALDRQLVEVFPIRFDIFDNLAIGHQTGRIDSI